MSSPLPPDVRTLAADLFEHHESVLDRLARKRPDVDFADLHDAFVQAILEVAAQPEKYEATRGTDITDFLVGAALSSLRTILRTTRRRIIREENRTRDVAAGKPAARSPVEKLVDFEVAGQARQVATNPVEEKVLSLWELGHSDAEIAEASGLDQEEAHRIRDRLSQRLRRLKQQFDREPDQ